MPKKQTIKTTWIHAGFQSRHQPWGEYLLWTWNFVHFEKGLEIIISVFQLLLKCRTSKETAFAKHHPWNVVAVSLLEHHIHDTHWFWWLSGTHVPTWHSMMFYIEKGIIVKSMIWYVIQLLDYKWQIIMVLYWMDLNGRWYHIKHCCQSFIAKLHDTSIGAIQ